MMVIVNYDVSTKAEGGKRRLRKVAETCLDYGLRVQNSVFECNVDPAQWENLKELLLSFYNEKEDSLRFYFLGSNWKKRLEHHGKNKNINIDDTLIL